MQVLDQMQMNHPPQKVPKRKPSPIPQPHKASITTLVTVNLRDVIQSHLLKDDLSKKDYTSCMEPLTTALQLKFKQANRSNHGMLDYLLQLWLKLSTPFSERVFLLTKLADIKDLDMVYQVL